MLRPGTGLPYSFKNKIIGKIALKNLEKNLKIKLNHFK